jgi:uncharacterized protein
MRIFVDADACPKVIKEILFRAAIRAEIKLILVANQRLETPRSPFISMQQVAAGFDVADNEIVLQLTPGDLVVTADIPLADAVIEKGGLALNPRGQLYTVKNIKERLSTRNIMAELRDTGIVTGGPSVLHKRDRQAFANQLDRLIAKWKSSPKDK